MPRMQSQLVDNPAITIKFTLRCDKKKKTASLLANICEKMFANNRVYISAIDIYIRLLLEYFKV